MKISAIAKTLLLGLLLGLLLILFWPFVIPGIILGLVFRGRRALLVSIVSALLLIAIYRFLNQEWTLTLGDPHDLYLPYQIVSGLISWAIGAMLFLAGYRVPSRLVEGFRSVTRGETKAPQDMAGQSATAPESKSE